jgi:hypothetical protein
MCLARLSVIAWRGKCRRSALWPSNVDVTFCAMQSRSDAEHVDWAIVISQVLSSLYLLASRVVIFISQIRHSRKFQFKRAAFAAFRTGAIRH